jgi:hypothetical protein
VSQLDCIRRRHGARNAGAQPEDKPAADELALSMGSRLDGSADDHDDAAHQDSHAAAVAVSEEAAEGESSDLAQLVDNEDDACGGPFAGEAHGFLVGLHGVDGAHERGVEAIERGDKVGDGEDGAELEDGF